MLQYNRPRDTPNAATWTLWLPYVIAEQLGMTTQSLAGWQWHRHHVLPLCRWRCRLGDDVVGTRVRWQPNPKLHFFRASVCIWKYWNCNITRNDVYSACFFVYSCVGVRESQASEIEIYHCPSCRITHGPLICEYFSQYCTNFVRLFILICPTGRYLHIGYKIVLLWFQSSCHWSVIGKVEVHGKLVRESLHQAYSTYALMDGQPENIMPHHLAPSGGWVEA